MSGFLNIELFQNQEFDLHSGLLAAGNDASADLIRKASLEIEPYSALLRRSFRNLNIFDAPERINDASLILGYSQHVSDLPIIYVGGHIFSPGTNMLVGEAYEHKILPADFTVWYLGARSFSSEEENWVRYNQRLITAFELDLEASLKTALAEINAPCRLIVNIDAVDPVWAPSVKKKSGFGYDPKSFIKAFKCLESSSVCSVQVCGAEQTDNERNDFDTARLCAEAARELSLIVFASKLSAKRA